MKNTIPGMGAFAVLALATGCASVSAEEDRARDFEIFVEDGALDEIEFSTDASSVDLSVDRERVGARFAFGGESARGYFQVFSEDWAIGSSSSTLYETVGVGGGAMGTPVLGDADGAVRFILPWRADLSVAVGESTNQVAEDTDLVYVELHADIGFGIDWKGLRPSAGLAVSSASGVLVPNVSNDVDISGVNTGFFVDLKYKHPEYVAYGHVRVLGGDYEATTLGIGFKF